MTQKYLRETTVPLRKFNVRTGGMDEVKETKSIASGSRFNPFTGTMEEKK